ncbi:MAG: [acyl-carrier-protein] S-malonyltransferase [Proteobacteria bacterium]|nr:[acyl-carrier-protein] S-malonyltransferase [Pseudomonadota bacterium]
MEEKMSAAMAWLFPGQGSQAVGMGQSLHRDSSAARDVFLIADAVWGGSLTGSMFDGPPEALQATVVTQPAIVSVSLAALAAVREAWEARHGIPLPEPSFVAGHSVGEFAAVVASGATDVATGLRLVCERARLMQWAADTNPGSMVAVLGLGRDGVEAACASARETVPGSYVSVANDNAHSPAQIVIAGDLPGLEAASAACRERGARRCVPLTVGGAFHSAAMAPAQEGLARAIAMAPFGDPRVPVIANVTAIPLRRARDIRAELAGQVVSPVRWADTVTLLAESGCRRFVEFGQGTVLGNLVQRAIPDAEVHSVGDTDGVGRVVEWLGSGAGENASA